MKKLALSAVLPIILATAPSIGFSHAHERFNGWYGGVSLGGAFRSGDGDSNDTTRIQIPSLGDSVVQNAGLRFDVKQNSLLGNLAVGYSHVWCDDYFTGAEAFVNFAEYNRTSPTLSESTNMLVGGGAMPINLTFTDFVKTRLNTAEFGIDFRPGYVLCHDTLLYGRIGVAFNKLKVSSNYSFTDLNGALILFGDLQNPADGGLSSVGVNKSRNVAALRLGLGMERIFCDCWSIRGDYVYTYYGKVQANSSAILKGSVAGVPFTSIAANYKKVVLQGNSVMFGLFYHW